MPINILISTNITSTKPTKHTEDVEKAKDKALTYTEKTVQRTHTVKKDIREAKEIKDSDKKSVIFVTNQAIS
jgi:hypothetical protein